MIQFLKNKKGKRLGFTLIELLTVVAIIGILSTLVFVSLNTARKKARDARRLADLQEIIAALEFYYQDHGHYPPGNTGIQGEWITHSLPGYAQLSTYLVPDYFKVMPNDPQSGYYAIQIRSAGAANAGRPQGFIIVMVPEMESSRTHESPGCDTGAAATHYCRQVGDIAWY